MTRGSDQPPLQPRRVHHVELWVGNARQAAYFYRRALGFSVIARAGLETGRRHSASYVLAQGRIRLVVTAPLGPDGAIAEHVRRHGDGVRDVAFEVDDAEAALADALARGAEAVSAVAELKDARGSVRTAAIRTYGDTVHTFVERGGYTGPFLPGYAELGAAGAERPDAGLLVIDHIVGNVEPGRMERWTSWYADTFGFERYVTFDDKDISTEFSALRSVVMADRQRVVKLPINEPAEGRRRSQIQEYLDYYGSAGVQHVALLTADIVHTVEALRARGVSFLPVPASYYDELPARVGEVDEPIDDLRRLGILVDREEQGYLLQLFTRPVQDRPTLFLEVIQRKGARGFGKGNFKALFEAIEREQQLRGNL